MAKKQEETTPEAGDVKTDRELRWEQYLEKYKVLNPIKYESKKKNGEFENIPDSFV